MIISNENNEGYLKLLQLIKENNPSSITILCDNNTKFYCQDYFFNKLQSNIKTNQITIQSGEINKNIHSLMHIWEWLLNYKVDRNGILINLGGGVITDIGGFAASTYKRGIKFINVPTTILAMVDASIGGKNGIDYKDIKNVIGSINRPLCTLIDLFYINTLSEYEIINGYAEMVKHILIKSPETWSIIKKAKIEQFISYKSLLESIAIKQSIVDEDVFENGKRKILNFGHTLGHAIESVFINNNKTIGHGIAISIGMRIAIILSYNLDLITEEERIDIETTLNNKFPSIPINKNYYLEILKYLKNDKKNLFGEIRFVLLEGIGKPVYDITISNKQIFRAIDQYNSSLNN